MWHLAYNAGLLLAAPVVLLILLAKKRCRRGLVERLGFIRRSIQADPSDRKGDADWDLLWVHAVSLGEVATVVPLIREFLRRHPGFRVTVSTATETGREAVEQRLSGLAEHFYAPLDFPWAVAHVIDRLRPKAYIFVDTELWPNLLRALAKRRIPSVLVNGRVSPRSYKRKSRLRSFWSQVLSDVTCLLMQSDGDAERVMALGAPRSRVFTTGTLKFDQPNLGEGTTVPGFSRASLGLGEREELLVAGSTHPDDEEQLLACYATLSQHFPNLVLLLAPRHIERASAAEATVRQMGMQVLRRSQLASAGDRERPQGQSSDGPRVLILDTRGELIYAYREGLAAFVGGTFATIGGHNLLEPALWGKPVFFGPHTDHCAEVAKLLIENGGGLRVRDGAALADELARKLADRSALDAMGKAARQVIDQNQGVLDRTLAIIERTLEDAQGVGTKYGHADLRLPKDPPQSTADAGPDAHDTARGSGAVPLPSRSRFGRAVANLAMWPYGLAVQARTALYMRGWLKRRKLPRPVISVGNLTVGGTGKTPLVIMLTNWLIQQGKRVAVLSRGYRRQSVEPVVMVSDGRGVLAGPAEAGDEPYLIATRCPGAIVAVGSDRHHVGQQVLDRFAVDCFLLDDGFQHVALQRDVDLLLVDLSDRSGLDGLFPVGRLREPLGSAARATCLVLTRVQGPAEWKSQIDRIMDAWGRPRQPVLVRFTGEQVVDQLDGTVSPIGSLAGTPLLAFSGIANPASFRDLLSEAGLNVVCERVFPDHHAYSAEDVERLLRLARESGAGRLLTTEKDAGKVATLFPAGSSPLALRLGIEILQGRTELESLILGKVDRGRAVAIA